VNQHFFLDVLEARPASGLQQPGGQLANH